MPFLWALALFFFLGHLAPFSFPLQRAGESLCELSRRKFFAKEKGSARKTRFELAHAFAYTLTGPALFFCEKKSARRPKENSFGKHSRRAHWATLPLPHYIEPYALTIKSYSRIIHYGKESRFNGSCRFWGPICPSHSKKG